MLLPMPAKTGHQSRHLAAHRARLQRVKFDPHNKEHIEAYRMLVQEGRQHPTIRFELEQPHVDLRAMMTSKVIDAFFEIHNTSQ